MLPQRNGLSLQSPLRPLSVLIFHLLLTHSCRGQSQLISTTQPIVATIGDDIILPCHLEPAVDVAAMTLEWTRPDLNSIFVFAWRAGQDLIHTKHPSYKGRTSLFTDELKRGNISLKLSDVRPSDAGRYRCFIPRLNIDSFVELVVGAVSSPVISLAGIDRDKAGVALQCECAGWYPEPEVLWLDGEGKLLSAGPTETVRGPDDLYTVSSRVTVEKRHSNSFTCRVQQRNINQTRETHIQVPDDFFKVQSSSSSTITALAVSLAVCILLILLLVYCVWKQRHNRPKTKETPSDEPDTGGTENPSGEEMKALKGKEEEKSKHWPLVSRRRFQAELQEKTQELQEEKTKNINLEKEVTTLKQEKTEGLQEEEKSRKEFEEEKKSLEQQLQNKSTQLQEEKTKNTDLEKEVTTLKQELQNRNTQLEKSQNKETETKHLLDTKTSEWKKLQTELQQEKTKNINLEKEVTTLKQVIEKKNTQLYHETQDTNRAQSEVQTLKNQLETKRREFEKQLQEEKKKNTELGKDIKTLNEELQNKNTQGTS